MFYIVYRVLITRPYYIVFITKAYYGCHLQIDMHHNRVMFVFYALR